MIDTVALNESRVYSNREDSKVSKNSPSMTVPRHLIVAFWDYPGTLSKVIEKNGHALFIEPSNRNTERPSPVWETIIYYTSDIRWRRKGLGLSRLTSLLSRAVRKGIINSDPTPYITGL